MLDWKHILTAIVFILIGYWIHGNYPGLLSKGTGGLVSG